MLTLMPLSVSAFNQQLREVLENSLEQVWLCGEVSGFTQAISGHWYFSLKDAHAQVRCVMFRPQNSWVKIQPYNGLQVEITARVGVYLPRGEYQLQVQQLLPAGVGKATIALALLQQRLHAEGLFASGGKRALPRYPQRIAVVTSPHSAAWTDVLTVLARRWPYAQVQLYPCTVQGYAAPTEIVQALDGANHAYPRCDVLLLVRGGGGDEDLSAFNDEQVVRAVANSAIPVVCGIGHERDWTLCEQAADVRAATPSAAAEQATPDREQLQQYLQQLHQRLHNCMEYSLAQARAKWQVMAQRHQRAGLLSLQRARAQLVYWHARLQAAHPYHWLSRGYVMLTDCTGELLPLPLMQTQTVWLHSQHGRQAVQMIPLPPV